ncbi:MAG: hypothetical protein OXF73_12860 [Gammaproteobacteria bacterium]|nr:hypothetical protein [Gammaproteobacteria bacterium]
MFINFVLAFICLCISGLTIASPEINDDFQRIPYQEGAVISVIVVLVAFVLKMYKGYIVNQNSKVTNLRVVVVYIGIAIKSWELDEENSRECLTETHRAKLAEIKNNLDKSKDSTVSEEYTPFVAFSQTDHLSIDDIRNWFGFLDKHKLDSIVEFIQNETLVYAIARDLRSEYVRQQFTAERKANLIELLYNSAYRATVSGNKVIKHLSPFIDCPEILWYLPIPNFIRYRVGHCRRGASRFQS